MHAQTGMHTPTHQGEDTCVSLQVHMHTHTDGAALLSISLRKMGQWGDFITLCKTHDSLTVSQYINPSIPSLSPPLPPPESLVYLYCKLITPWSHCVH